MNIQTSRAIYDMPIISPQHAHWRAVRKLFDKKSASGASPISTHFQFEWRHGGERRRPRSMKAGAATSDLGCEYNPFLLFQTQLRLRSTCKAIDQLFSPQSWPFITFRLTLHLLLFGYYETIWNTLILISLLQLKTHTASQKPWHPQAPCATCADKKTPWRPIATACKNF